MNKKLKCLLSAALVLVMLMSVAIAAPATAAESDEPAAVSDAEASTLAIKQTEDGSDVFADGNTDLSDIAVTGEPAETGNEDELPVSEIETTAPAAEPDMEADLNPVRKGSYTNRIVIKWNKVGGVEGYRVYWRDMLKVDSDYKLLSIVKDNSITVSNLKSGSKYRFTVRAYIKQDGKIKEGKIARVTAATIPPAAKNLRLTSAAQKATAIKWTAVKNIDGYVLWRQYNGVWKEYKRLSAKTSQFIDRNVVAGKLYRYRLLTYRKDNCGYTKNKSDILSVVCGMCAPADAGSTSRGNRVYLSWRKTVGATGYLVWYSTDNKDFKGLTDTTSTTATTKKFKEGTKVYFRIQPYRLVGAKKTRVPGTISNFSVKVLANSFGADVGNTYIEIDISEQHLWFVKKGEVIVSTPVVTGNNNSMDTPKGIFSIRGKSRNVSLVGAGYVSFVEYWMPFIGSSYGIHDASWRSSFGGQIYKGNGSHGCVNTPYDAVKKIYNNVSVGTPVVIHK